MDGTARILLLAGLAAALLCLAVALRARWRARRVVGRVLVARRARRAPRVVLAVAALALGVAASVGGQELAAPGIALALCSAALALATPAEGERLCGERGLRAGWEALRYEELSEWRLTGEHLRFRGAGEWTAVDAPRALHAELRALLEARCGERESRFRE